MSIDANNLNDRSDEQLLMNEGTLTVENSFISDSTFVVTSGSTVRAGNTSIAANNIVFAPGSTLECEELHLLARENIEFQGVIVQPWQSQLGNYNPLSFNLPSSSEVALQTTREDEQQDSQHEQVERACNRILR